MESDSFHITLSSNVASPKYFPENTIANFRTKLPTRLKLKDEYEVALIDFQCTYSWFNVTEDYVVKLISYDPETNVIQEFKTKTIKRGQYSINLLVEKLQNSINEISKLSATDITITPAIAFHENKKIKFTFGLQSNTKPVGLILDPYIWGILGFDYEKTKTEIESTLLFSESTFKSGATPSIKAHNIFDIKGGIHSLYIYSDIVAPSIVGDSFNPLLRVVSIPRKIEFGDEINADIKQLIYYPIAHNEFETIEVNIKDDSDENIKFLYGRSEITLSFRKLYKNKHIKS